MSPAGAVRAAGAHERAALGELLGLLLEHHRDHPRFRLGPIEGQREGALASLLTPYLDHPDGRIFVAEGPEGLTGMVSVAIARREPPFAETRRGQIEHLVVRPGLRKQGIGRALVEAAFGWLKSADIVRVELQVDQANPEGRAFWAALGFEDALSVLERDL